jgi:hypothetical protein
VKGQQTESEQVVCLATAHRLAQQEGAGSVLGSALQPLESLGEEGLHALGDIVLREESLGVYVSQIIDTVNGIADVGVENGWSRGESWIQSPRRH